MALGEFRAWKTTVETRFNLSSIVLDRRGEILHRMSSMREMDQVRVSADKMQCQSKDGRTRFHISPKNAFVSHECFDGWRDFTNTTGGFFRHTLWEHLSIPEFKWVGCRTQGFIVVESFEDLRDELVSVINIPDGATEAIGLPLYDIGFPFVFENDNRKISITFGPMLQDQMKGFFEFEEGLPEEALFIDVDYIDKVGMKPRRLRQFAADGYHFATRRAVKFINSFREGA